MPWVSCRSPATSRMLRVTAEPGLSGASPVVPAAGPGLLGAPQADRLAKAMATNPVTKSLLRIVARPSRCVWGWVSGARRTGRVAHHQLGGQLPAQDSGPVRIFEQLQEQVDPGPAGALGRLGQGGE